jgi:hypothetical protein
VDDEVEIILEVDGHPLAYTVSSGNGGAADGFDRGIECPQQRERCDSGLLDGRAFDARA